MIGAGVGAGNIGVQCFDFVGKSIGGKKIQSAISDGGLTAKSTRIKPREDVIGPQGAMFRNKNFQRATADRSEFQAQCIAGALGRGESRRDARRVIVGMKMCLAHGGCHKQKPNQMQCYYIAYCNVIPYQI